MNQGDRTAKTCYESTVVCNKRNLTEQQCLGAQYVSTQDKPLHGLFVGPLCKDHASITLREVVL